MKHGAGKKWFENVRNYSRELFNEQYIQEFMLSYFSGTLEESYQNFLQRQKALNDPITLGVEKKNLKRDIFVIYIIKWLPWKN